MKYSIDSGQVINIPDNEIKNLMDNLEINQIEAVELWLTDNDYKVNQEQQKLDEKAKTAKVSMDVERKKRKPRKPQNIKVSQEKKDLYSALGAFLGEYCSEKGGKYEVLTENKLFSVRIGDKKFKLDLIQTRKQQKVRKMCSFNKKLHIFCAFFYYFMLDKPKILQYNGGSHAGVRLRIFADTAICTIFESNLCAFCLLLLS